MEQVNGGLGFCRTEGASGVADLFPRSNIVTISAWFPGRRDFIFRFVVKFEPCPAIFLGGNMPHLDSNPQRAKTTSPAEQKPPFLSLAIVSARQPKLNLGRIVITSNADSSLTREDVIAALRRHVFGDWGTVCRRLEYERPAGTGSGHGAVRPRISQRDKVLGDY
jgi:hypothetical protein